MFMFLQKKKNMFMFHKSHQKFLLYKKNITSPLKKQIQKLKKLMHKKNFKKKIFDNRQPWRGH